MFGDLHSFAPLAKIFEKTRLVSALLKSGDAVPIPRMLVVLSLVSGLVGVSCVVVGVHRVLSSTVNAQTTGITFSEQTSISEQPLLEVEREPAELMVIVEVAGAVSKPGLYMLPTDARVGDALRASGGVTDQVDSYYLSTTLNLSSKVSDGEKIYIPSVGDQSVTKACAQILGRAEASDTAEKQSQIGDPLVSLNTATQAELEELPGIGSKRATDIITGRPYASVDELLTKSIVTEKIFAEIEKLLIM